MSTERQKTESDHKHDFTNTENLKRMPTLNGCRPHQIEF